MRKLKGLQGLDTNQVYDALTTKPETASFSFGSRVTNGTAKTKRIRRTKKKYDVVALETDMKQAETIATAAAESAEDTGMRNRNCVILGVAKGSSGGVLKALRDGFDKPDRQPMWSVKYVNQPFVGTGYLLRPIGYNDAWLAGKREAAVEAMARHLQQKGHNASVVYQLD